MPDSMTPNGASAFDDLLERFRRAPSIGTDDCIGAVRALLEEVRDLNEAGQVADLDRIDLLALGEAGELRLGRVPVGPPTLAEEALRRIESQPSQAVDIVRQIGVSEAGGQVAAWDRSIAEAGQVPDRPLFYPNYGSWERAIGHHDALTDVFHLGLVIASLATGLDLRDRGDLAKLVGHRTNLLRLNARLHPAIARIVADMTEPTRAARAADLATLIDLIDDYRTVEVDDARNKARDLADLADPKARRQLTQEYFRNRLFEVTRRNKLLYFADRHGVDLTRGSFPLMLNYQTSQARQLLTASPELLKELARLNDRGEPKGELDLRRWLQCVDYPFLAPSLDKVRAAARKDLRELGFNQLRLVLAFLRWHDDDKAERISTPLVMLPVTLKKQPGTADGFSLVIEGPVAEAEVNPVLRYIMAERFRIALPETLDLGKPEALADLRARLEREVRRVKPGVAISFVDKPRVQLIQKTIKRQLDDHRRRQRRAGQELKDWRGVSYSYAADSYQPLGLELFDRFVRLKAAPGREFANGAPAVTSGVPDHATEQTTTAETYAIETGAAGDPLNWEIDLCAVTLANFNTRKMSLVRDYEVLLGDYQGEHANYTRLFEHGARPALADTPRPGHTQRSFVLPSDPSQDEAILRAGAGESYVIQGPPGTGKSQTIANLLADLAAQGRTVLFVCEKRVALDVVHNRLKEAGIGDLACLVHDAREDRLEFIADLKVLYEDWQASRTSRTIRDRRTKLAEEIDGLIARLAGFSDAMQRPVDGAGGASVRALMGRAIAENIAPVALASRDRERVPAWDAFEAGETALAALEQQVLAASAEPEAVADLLRMLRTEFAETSRPIAFLDQALPEARRGLADIQALAAAAFPVSPGRPVTLAALNLQAPLAARLRVLAEIGKLNLLDPLDPETSRLQKQLLELARLDQALATAAAPNTGWTRKPSATETETALALAREKEGRFLSFLSGDWRALKRMVAGQFNGAPQSLVQLLERLAAEHAARTQRDAHHGQIRQGFGLDDVAEVQTALAAVWRGDEAKREETALIEACVRDPRAAARSVLQLANDRQRLARAEGHLDKLLSGFDEASPDSIDQRLATLEKIKDEAADLARRMRGLEKASGELATAWRELRFDLATFRAAALHTSIARGLEPAPDAQLMTAAELQKIAESLAAKLVELRQLNAKRTLDDQKARFRMHGIAGRRDYDAGRAFLEHQFSLQRPSAAMRDFLAGDPARVVRDLKPIWMMSPLSVADTLPLGEGLFDVVVFDEASQIPIEDAVPTLYRAPQAIVVGDEMQLPPPSYFARKLDTDEEELPDYIAFGMQAESLLDKAVVALPSTRLDWHYRSRHEGLIGFCNQAFYAGQLKTIPSRQLLETSEPIDTATPVPMKAQAQRVLSRPISFHKLADGVFANQQNLREAAYIAELVRSLLSQDGDMSIGIVAFSQPQQAAIEAALEKLAAENQTFRSRLDKALAQEHEELFVKNLENVQGDERDIMIVSVAYGPGAGGRMIMNFGPINQEGGEKRLNVIFSRAKHHMVVVTSIDPARITNDYNKGANALKRYMMYAAAASIGDTAAMRVALTGYPGAEHVDRSGQLPDPLADRIAEVQARSGQDVVRGLGQSTARCDVAVKPAGAGSFTTAILTDSDSHYEVTDVVDRYVTYPALLRASGWKVEFALAKDWLARPVKDEQ